MVGRYDVRTAFGRRAAVRALASVFAIGFAASVALAQDAAEDVRRRMEDRLYFVSQLGRGRAWEPLLTDLRATIESLPEADRPVVLPVRDDAWETYANLRARDGTDAGPKRAFELYVSLSLEAVESGRRPEFARRAAEIEVAWAAAAEKSGDDRRALELALSAAERSPGFEPAYDVIARLGIRQAEKAEAEEEYADAFDILDRSTQLLPATSAARAKLESKRQSILGSTGPVTVEWLGSAERLARVRGPKTDFTDASLELRPVGGERAPKPRSVRGSIRVRNGRYAVAARAGSGPPFDAGQVDVTPAGATVTIPVAIPANMVLVRPVGGQEAFLIDRTEVTASELRSPGGGNVGGDRTPAAGVTFSKAAEYARAAGKELPTLAQWLTAAFGDPGGRGRRYPWGDQPGTAGIHFAGGVDSPRPVDDCPSGASAAGCLNMAGNVWEWLADDRFIGGGHRRSDSSFTFTTAPKDDNDVERTFDVTREPAPSDEHYERMSPDDRTRYFGYRPKGNQSTLDQIGLRCVVPLGPPRRQP